MEMEKIAEESLSKLDFHLDSMHITPGLVTGDMVYSLLTGFHEGESAIPLSDGWDIVKQRSDVLDAFMKKYFQNLQERHDLFSHAALFAVGGNGRQELTPTSDSDLQLFYSGISDEHPFLRDYCNSFSAIVRSIPGIWGIPVVNSIDDIAVGFGQVRDGVKESLGFGNDHNGVKKVFSLVDMRFLEGDKDIEMTARTEIGRMVNPLEQLLEIIPLLDRQTQDSARIYDFEPFNIKTGVGGLRHFQKAIVVRSKGNFVPSLDIYKTLNPEIIESVGILLKTRSWLNASVYNLTAGSKKDAENEAFNELRPCHVVSLKESLGPDAIDKLISARKQIVRFAHDAFGEWVEGLPVNGYLSYSLNGLSLRGGHADSTRSLYSLLLEAQSRRIPISPEGQIQLARSDNLRPDKAFLDLLRNNGDLAPTLGYLMKADAISDLLPGWAQLESAFFEEGHVYNRTTRAGRAIERVRNLDALRNEHPLSDEYQSLPKDALMSLRLALLYKGIPVVTGKSALESLAPLKTQYSLDDSILDLTAYLIDQKNLIFDSVHQSVVDDKSIKELCGIAKDKETLQALILFTAADRDMNAIDSTLENLKHVYGLCHSSFDGNGERSLDSNNMYPEGRLLMQALPVSYIYGRHSKNLLWDINDLVNVSESGKPIIRADQLKYSDNSVSIKVVAPDYRGLFWRIAGHCLDNKVSINQANIFSLSGQELILDYLDVTTPESFDLNEFRRSLSTVISSKSDLVDISAKGILDSAYKDQKILSAHLDPQNGHYKLHLKGTDQLGLLYATARILSEEGDADIIRINAYIGKHGAANGVFLFTTPHTEPGAFLKEHFPNLQY